MISDDHAKTVNSILTKHTEKAVIIRLKSSLGFNIHAIGKKHITIDVFSENVYLFYLKMKIALGIYLVNENTNVFLRML